MVSASQPVQNAELFDGLVVVPNIIGGGKIRQIPDSIKRQAMDRDFQPSVRIGKTGITPNIIEEIGAQLKKRKLVKIKLNKGIYDRDSRTQIWDYLAEETSSMIVLARGNVGVLWLQS